MNAGASCIQSAGIIVEHRGIDVDVAFHHPASHLHGRVPGLASASGWRSLPTRTSRPRFEAAAIMFPFSMKPIPPNIFTSRTSSPSARAHVHS